MVIFMVVGFLTHGMMTYQAPKEKLIEIDMSMVEPQRARSVVPKLPTQAPVQPIQSKAVVSQEVPKTAPVESVSPMPSSDAGWLAPTGSAATDAVEADGGGDVDAAIAEVGDSGGGEGEGDAIGRFLARVEDRKEYPFMAVRRNLTGVVTVGVAIDTDGNLVESYIVQSSGAKILDEAGLKAVQKSCPFPHDVGRTLRMNIPISFYLN